MIEVFKTNVTEEGHAERVAEAIMSAFSGHLASFDLEDCDRILRIVCPSGLAEKSELIGFLGTQGVKAEVLQD